MNILVTGIGGPTPRSIARALRNSGRDFRIIGVDANPKALGFFMKGLVDDYFVAPRVSEGNYWNFIHELIAREKIDFAIVQPEKEVIAWGAYFLEHGKYPIPAVIPPHAHSTVLVDKAAMATLLEGTSYIPKTVRISPSEPKFNEIETEIGYPCWIRASVGSGGLGSLCLKRKEELEAWLFIHKDIKEFTVSEFLTGRHLANQMLYDNGVCLKNAGLHCAEYVMADIAPSKVTGNTSYGLFLNEKKLLDFCEEVMDYIQNKTGVKAHGVYSFDLKENASGNLMVTEINIRHMAYTGIMARVGFDLTMDSLRMLEGKTETIDKGQYTYSDEYVFLRDVDIEPIILTIKELKQK